MPFVLVSRKILCSYQELRRSTTLASTDRFYEVAMTEHPKVPVRVVVGLVGRCVSRRNGVASGQSNVNENLEYARREMCNLKK